MDNISEARTEIESIIAAPSSSHHTGVVPTSVSQEPIDGGGQRDRLKSYDESESGETNVSLVCPKITEMTAVANSYWMEITFFAGL